ncbi:MAG: hypothetical protein Q9187_009202, partial [Circinaria calcarea]
YTESSERQYKRKITKWQLNKNIKSHEKVAIIDRDQLKRKLDDDTKRYFTIDGREVPGHKIRRYMRTNTVELKIPINPRSAPINEDVLYNTSLVPIEQDIPDDTRSVPVSRGHLDDMQSEVMSQDNSDNSETSPDNLRYMPCSAPLKLAILRDTHDELTKEELGPCVLGNRCSRHICYVISKFEKMSVEEVHNQAKRTLESPRESHGFYYDSATIWNLNYATIRLPNFLAILPNSPNTLFHQNSALGRTEEKIHTFVSSGDTETVTQYKQWIYWSPRNRLEFILYVLDTPWARSCF